MLIGNIGISLQKMVSSHNMYLPKNIYNFGCLYVKNMSFASIIICNHVVGSPESIQLKVLLKVKGSI